jgi:GT2 family glycosyltransferase
MTDRRGSAPSMPHVAVIVLTWNGWRDTIECLESLFHLDYPALTVVVCDNGSTDGSIEQILGWARGNVAVNSDAPVAVRKLLDPPVAKPIPFLTLSRHAAENADIAPVSMPLVLIDNEANLGFAGGNNVGLRFLFRQPSIDYAWILNNDIVVAPDSLRRMVEAAEARNSQAAVSATLYEYSEPDVVQAAGGGTFGRWRGHPRPMTRLPADGAAAQPLDYLATGCMLVPLKELREVGTIDERYFLYGEDIDISLRLRQAHLALVHAVSARVWHKGAAGTGQGSPRHDYYIVRNHLDLARRHFPLTFPFALAYTIYRCALPKIVRGDWERLRAVWRGFSDFRAGVFGPMPTPPTRSR